MTISSKRLMQPDYDAQMRALAQVSMIISLLWLM